MRDLFRIGPLVVKFDAPENPFSGVNFWTAFIRRARHGIRRPWCTHRKHEWIDHGMYWAFACEGCGSDEIGGHMLKLAHLPQMNWKKYDWKAYNERIKRG